MSGLGVTGCRKRARFNVCKLKSECEKELSQGKKNTNKDYLIWMAQKSISLIWIVQL